MSGAAGTAPLRVAVIGTGMIARVHLDSARRAGATVVGVLGSAPERSAKAAAAWGLPRGFRDMDELLAAAPDVVHVCVPNALHAPYARAVLAEGIHLVCEKPLGADVAEADEIAGLAGAAGVVATVPFVYRYHPMVREVRARVQAGELGRLLVAHGTYLQDWMLDPAVSGWRVDPRVGGRSRTFADIGSHWCDLFEFLSGERIAEASALLSVAHRERPRDGGESFAATRAGGATVEVETEDAALVHFRTQSGVPVSVVASQVSAGRKNRLWVELDGSEGSVVFDQEHAEQASFGRADGFHVLRRGEGAVAPDQARLNVLPAGHAQGWGDAFAAFVADTYEAVRGGDPTGLPTVQDGLRAARIVDGVVRSARTGGWETV